MVARFTERALVQLADEADWNDAARERVSWALDSASTKADGYLATIFAAGGATTIPPLITDIVCDLAFYALHTDPPKKVVADRDLALKMLEQIRDGKIKVDEGNVDAIAARPDAVLISDPGRIFSRDSMRGF
jgi:phage gp36-like protein